MDSLSNSILSLKKLILTLNQNENYSNIYNKLITIEKNLNLNDSNILNTSLPSTILNIQKIITKPSISNFAKIYDVSPIMTTQNTYKALSNNAPIIINLIENLNNVTGVTFSLYSSIDIRQNKLDILKPYYNINLEKYQLIIYPDYRNIEYSISVYINYNRVFKKGPYIFNIKENLPNLIYTPISTSSITIGNEKKIINIHEFLYNYGLENNLNHISFRATSPYDNFIIDFSNIEITGQFLNDNYDIIITPCNIIYTDALSCNITLNITEVSSCNYIDIPLVSLSNVIYEYKIINSNAFLTDSSIIFSYNNIDNIIIGSNINNQIISIMPNYRGKDYTLDIITEDITSLYLSNIFHFTIHEVEFRFPQRKKRYFFLRDNYLTTDTPDLTFDLDDFFSNFHPEYNMYYSYDFVLLSNIDSDTSTSNEIFNIGGDNSNMLTLTPQNRNITYKITFHAYNDYAPYQYHDNAKLVLITNEASNL